MDSKMLLHTTHSCFCFLRNQRLSFSFREGGIDIIKVGKLVSLQVIKNVLAILGNGCQRHRDLLELCVEIFGFARIALQSIV